MLVELAVAYVQAWAVFNSILSDGHVVIVIEREPLRSLSCNTLQFALINMYSCSYYIFWKYNEINRNEITWGTLINS